MYHEKTYEQIERAKRKRLTIAISCLVVFVLIAGITFFLGRGAREQAAFSIRESVINAAKNCCAVEGAYPSTLGYLEKNYGLVINHDDYTVDYEWFADNVPPSVVVKQR